MTTPSTQTTKPITPPSTTTTTTATADRSVTSATGTCEGINTLIAAGYWGDNGDGARWLEPPSIEVPTIANNTPSAETDADPSTKHTTSMGSPPTSPTTTDP